MTKSEHGTLHEAMLAIQQELKDPQKGSVNPHFKSNYADLKAVCDCIRPVAHKHGVYFAQGGGLVEGTFILGTRIIHAPSGQELESQLPLGSPDQKIQELCGRITYLRRYALVAAFGLAPEDEDDDGEAAMGRGRGATPGRPKRQDAEAERKKILVAIGEKWKALGLTNDSYAELMKEGHLDPIPAPAGLKSASRQTLDKVLEILTNEERLRQGAKT